LNLNSFSVILEGCIETTKKMSVDVIRQINWPGKDVKVLLVFIITKYHFEFYENLKCCYFLDYQRSNGIKKKYCISTSYYINEYFSFS